MNNKTIDKRSLTVIALIKYEIVQLNKALNDKNCPSSETEKIENKITELLVVLQLASNSDSTIETFNVLCKWINQSKILADSAVGFFNSEEFAQETISMDERDVKTLDHIRDNIPEIMKVKINEEELKKQFINSAKGN